MKQEQVLKGFAIVVIERGFVYVGQAEVSDGWCVISDAQNIRRWGTTRGLGELAAGGPTEKTMLDPSGVVRIPLHAVIHLIDTEAALWKR